MPSKNNNIYLVFSIKLKMTLEEKISRDLNSFRKLISFYGGRIPQTRFNRFLLERASGGEHYMDKLITALYRMSDNAKNLLKCSPPHYKLPEGTV